MVRYWRVSSWTVSILASVAALGLAGSTTSTFAGKHVQNVVVTVFILLVILPFWVWSWRWKGRLPIIRITTHRGAKADWDEFQRR